MLTELCQELHNWFEREIHTGSFTITGGNITADFLQDGQYFRIAGSIFNDGIHQYPATDLREETFDGAVWALAIPKEFINLCDRITAFNAKVDEMALVEKGYASENFGGYSYTLSSSAPAGMLAWEKRINAGKSAWRKL